MKTGPWTSIGPEAPQASSPHTGPGWANLEGWGGGAPPSGQHSLDKEEVTAHSSLLRPGASQTPAQGHLHLWSVSVCPSVCEFWATDLILLKKLCFLLMVFLGKCVVGSPGLEGGRPRLLPGVPLPAGRQTSLTTPGQGVGRRPSGGTHLQVGGTVLRLT